jgi:hypothetical protein
MGIPRDDKDELTENKPKQKQQQESTYEKRKP